MFGIDDAVLFAGGAKLLGGFMDNAAADARSESAQAFSAQQYATRYQTQVKDMMAAGLNPMLSYTQAPGNSPGGVVSTPGNQYSGVSDSYLQAKMNSAQVANVMADTENKKAQASLIEAEISDKLASAQHKGALVSNVEATTSKIHEEIKNIKVDRVRIEAAMYNLAEHTALMRLQGKTEAVRADELRGIVEKLRLNNSITQADYDAMVKTGFIGRLAREVKPASDIASDWLSPGKWLDKLLPNATRGKSTTTRESGTTFDRKGHPSGGYSRERSTIEE